MSDRTTATLVVHAADAEELAAIRAELAEWSEDDLMLGESCYLDDVDLGFASEFGPKLVEVAPEARFTLWTSPKYEWLGEVFVHVPGLEDFESECDDDGNVVLGWEDVAPHLDRPDLAEWLAQVYGRAHFDVLATS